MSAQEIAHYKILKKIGKGGMGEVFLVQDTRLSRKVALKLLSAEVIDDQKHLHRFEQEARAISTLNHPNILTIYEIGQSNGSEYIATEYVDGETLRELLTRRQIDLQKLLDIAAQIAAALEAAHASGIIHRDIKPENVMIRRDGLVKVLDFGLAKLTERTNEAMMVDSTTPTRAHIHTEPGMVLGTVFYMSPEQARGKKVDARSDIWSLGVVLYEMITRHHPFGGETKSDVIASILKTEPLPLTTHAPKAPSELQRIIKKTLQKDREERYQVVKDLLLDLKSLKRELNDSAEIERSAEPHLTETVQANVETDKMRGLSTQSPTNASYLGTTESREWLWLVGILLLSLVAASGWYFWRQQRLGTGANIVSSLAITQLISWKNDLGEESSNRARFSPDGKFIVFSSTKGGSRDIWLKQTSEGDAIERTKDEWADSNPIWSPDGGQIAFLSERINQKGIWKMSALSGLPTLIKPLESLNASLVQWSKDGKTIYYNTHRNLYALDITSQQATQLTNFDTAQPTERDFRFSPDEQRIVYTDNKDGQRDIWVMSKTGENPVRVTNDKDDDYNPVWTSDGERIVYSSTRNGIKQIYLAFADARPPAQLNLSNSDSEVLDISPDGSKILYSTDRDESDLWSVNLETKKELQLTSDMGVELWSSVSPDGNWVVFQATNTPNTGKSILSCSLLKKSLPGDSQPTQLADEAFDARWSPDGKQLAFLRFDNKISNLWTLQAEGGNAKQLTNDGVAFGGFSFLPYNRGQTQDYQWSLDGQKLIYCAHRAGISNVWQINADGSNETQLSDNSNANLLFFNPILSPDGKRFAWLSLELSQTEQNKKIWSVWVSEEGSQREIFKSESIVRLVGWSPSSQELIVGTCASNINLTIPTDVNLFVLTIDGGSRPLAQLAKTYFQNIQLSPDGKRIAYVTRKDVIGSLQIIPSTGGTAQTVITGGDSRIYFSSLAWSPDGKAIYYGKQASWSVISLIENFK